MSQSFIGVRNKKHGKKGKKRGEKKIHHADRERKSKYIQKTRLEKRVEKGIYLNVEAFKAPARYTYDQSFTRNVESYVTVRQTASSRVNARAASRCVIAPDAV